MQPLSVHYGLVAMVVAEVLVIAVLAYLRSGSGREPYLGAWLVSYAGQLTLHLAWHPPMAGYASIPLFAIGGAGGLIGAMALLYGTFQHLGRPMPRGWRTVGMILLSVTVALGLMGRPASEVAIPIALSLGLAYFATGFVVMRSGPKSLGVGMAGIGMMALGLHSIDFPILGQIEDFVSWGQLINSWLLLMVGMGLVLMHTERVERRSAEQHRALQQAQRMEAIGRLAGGVAHDFNNLLTVINVNLSMAARKASPSTGHLLEAAQTAADHAASVTKKLLTFSRPKPRETVDVDLAQVVERIVGVLRCTIEDSVEIALELEREGVVVAGDPGEIEQVVLNLTLNARDAMPDGGLLSVRVSARADASVLEVEDTGEGMAPEVVGHIFEPFFTTKEVGKGTGFGLATVYAVITRLGGTIDVDSTPGVGTLFRVVLPAADRRAAAPEIPAPETEEVVAHGADARILLVEDRPELSSAVQQILESVGFHVVSAADGAEALERAAGDSFELIVTDVVMPRMSGPELVRALRKRDPDLPVLYMSGYADRDKNPVERGDEQLAKPFTPDDLLEAVNRVRGKRLPDSYAR